MKKQTAMMSAIAHQKEMIKLYTESRDSSPVGSTSYNNYDLAIKLANNDLEFLTEILPFERQQIEDAYNEGALWSGDTASDFFTQTYEQK